MSKRIIGILSGEDASIEHVVAPANLDLDAAYQAYRKWYHDEYCPAYAAHEAIMSIPKREATPQPKFLMFHQWLIKKHKCIDAPNDVVEVFMEGTWDLVDDAV